MMRRHFLTLALLAAAAPLAAQDIANSAVIVDPQFVSYQLGTGGSARTVSQFGMPIAWIVPFNDRFNMDISTNFASSSVKTPGSSTSSISGLTDAQIRGNLTLGDNAAVVTLGLNVPTGQYKVPDGEQVAAGQIGNDFLIYPVSSMGNGLAMTGGIAFAQALGDWNLGFGGSFRYSSAFDAYEVQTTPLRFTPGAEARLRVGLDRPVGDGSFNVSLTYSKFGNYTAADSSYGSGDRAMVQSAYGIPIGGNRDLEVSLWDLYRGVGQQIGGVPSPSENVGNIGAAVGFQLANGVYLQPNIEERDWIYNNASAGLMTNLGVRVRFDWKGLNVNPSLGYTIGSLTNVGQPSTDLTGFKVALLIRLH
jgi:hypothetical protein